MSKGTFKAEFLKQLNNEDLPLVKRLNIALGAVVSQCFPLQSKEQTTLDWYADCLQKHQLQPTVILKVVKKTLACEAIAGFSEPIDPTKLIKAFIQTNDNQSKKCKKLLITCVLLLLESPGFQRFCRFDIKPMHEASMIVCHHMALIKECLDGDNEFIKTGLERLLLSIHNVYKITQQRSELKICFTTIILPDLLQLKYDFQQCQTFKTLFDEVVIGENWQLVCEAFKVDTGRKIYEHLKALVNLMTNPDHARDAAVLNSLLCNIYVESCQKNAKNEANPLAMFYVLVSVVGIPIKLPYTTVVNTHLTASQQLSVLRELVSVIQTHNIPVSQESEEGLLSTILLSIEKHLLSDDCVLTVDLLRLLQILFMVYPESVKYIFSESAQHIIFVKKYEPKLVKSYNNFLVNLMKSFSNLNQLDKFFAQFSHKCSLAWKDNRLYQLSLEMILPPGFFSLLSQEMPSLNGRQLETILMRMVINFTKYFVTESNNFSDPSFRLYLEISTRLLCCVLESTVIVTPTRWPIVSGEIANLILAVQKFGDIALTNLGDESLSVFIQLVEDMVYLEQMHKHYKSTPVKYDVIPRMDSSDKHLSMFDLHETHGFLKASDWHQISEYITTSSNAQLKHCWYELLMQKHFQVKDPEIAIYLTLNADSEWLIKSFTRLSNCVPSSHLQLYTERLLDPDTNATCHFVDDPSVMECVDVYTNRPFRAAMNFQVLKQMSEAVLNKKALSRNMTKVINVPMILQHEENVAQTLATEISLMSNALYELINQCHWDNSSSDLSQNNKIYLERIMRLTTVLRPHCLKAETKRIICLILIGLTYDLRQEGSLVQSLLETLIGCLDDRNPLFPEALDRRVLVQWLVNVIPQDFLNRHNLNKLVIMKILHSLPKNIDAIIDVIQNDTDFLSDLLESLIQVHGNKGLKNNKEMHKLATELIYRASSVLYKKQDLKLYTVALKAEYVFCKDKKPTLITDVSTYLDELFQRFQKESNEDPVTTELIDLTLNLQSHIDTNLMENLSDSITAELCKVNFCPMLCYPSTLRTFFQSQTLTQFETTLNDVCKYQREAFEMALSNVCELWIIIVESNLARDKALMIQRLLKNTLDQCHLLIVQHHSMIHPSIVKLLHTIAHTKSMTLTENLLDLIFVILEKIPTERDHQLLPDCLTVLDSLIIVRSELILDRIPVYLNVLEKLIKYLVVISTTDNSHLPSFNSICIASVNQVTRITKTIVDQHAKHFVRISPYIIANLLHLMVSHSIASFVKSELQTCICTLLSICDHRGTQQLQSVLSLPAMEMFKVLSTTFKKSYKYTGKV